MSLEAFATAAAVVALLLIVTVAIPLAMIRVAQVVTSAIIGGRTGRIAGRGVVLVLVAWYLVSPIVRLPVAVVFYTVEPSRIPLVRLDLALSRLQREAVVGMALRGELDPAPYGALQLPAWARGLSVHGTVEVVDGPCGKQVFFMTVTGFSPDPYGGLESVPNGCDPEPDPLGSGQGFATDLGDHWFWIVAR